MSRTILLTVVMAAIIGYFTIQESWIIPLERASLGFLYLLLVGVGFDLASTPNSLSLTRGLTPLALLGIPLSALGSIGGAALVMALLGGKVSLGAAIGAGFGWYSLASVILAGEVGATAAALAFLCNIIRELIAFLLMPLATRRYGIAGVALGGATTMDTTLKIVSAVGDHQLTIFALVHGMTLSAAVPLLVPLLAQFNP